MLVTSRSLRRSWQVGPGAAGSPPCRWPRGATLRVEVRLVNVFVNVTDQTGPSRAV